MVTLNDIAIKYKATIYNSITSSEDINGMILNIKKACDIILIDKTGNPFKKFDIENNVILNLFNVSDTLDEFICEIYNMLKQEEKNFNYDIKLLSLNDAGQFKEFKHKYINIKH